MVKEELQEVKVTTGPKKIIRKLLSKSKKEEDDEIAEWKPIKIVQNEPKNGIHVQKEKLSLADSFLSSLSKPNNTSKSKEPSLEMTYKTMKKPVKVIEPTEEQIKWDIQDQSFIRKEFGPAPNVENALESIDQEGETVDKIKWLNQKEQPMKEIDMTKIIEENWKQTETKQKLQQDIYKSSLIEGRGQLSAFVKDASRYEEDEKSLNANTKRKNMIRTRYGW